jgi:hypothetical protein
MPNRNTYDDLERERSKLIMLIIESSNHGKSLTQNEAILEQSRKCDALIAMIQKEKDKYNQIQRER